MSRTAHSRKPRPAAYPRILWVAICDNGHALCATAKASERGALTGACEPCPPSTLTSRKRPVKYVLA